MSNPRVLELEYYLQRIRYTHKKLSDDNFILHCLCDDELVNDVEKEKARLEIAVNREFLLTLEKTECDLIYNLYSKK